MRLIDSDDEEEDQSAGNSAVTERERVANELFEGDDDAGEVPIVEHFLFYLAANYRKSSI